MKTVKKILKALYKTATNPVSQAKDELEGKKFWTKDIGRYINKNEEVELDEVAMNGLYQAIDKHIEPHIKAYKAGKIDADTLGDRVVGAHYKIAKETGHPIASVKNLVNNHVDHRLSEEVELDEKFKEVLISRKGGVDSEHILHVKVHPENFKNIFGHAHIKKDGEYGTIHQFKNEEGHLVNAYQSGYDVKTDHPIVSLRSVGKTPTFAVNSVRSHITSKKHRNPVSEEVKNESIELDEGESINRVTVHGKRYSWGKMMTVHDGKDISYPLHPEHQNQIKKLAPNGTTMFTDETNRRVTARRSGDGSTIHLNGQRTKKVTNVPFHHFNEDIKESRETDFDLSDKHGKPVGSIYKTDGGWGEEHHETGIGHDGYDTKKHAIDGLKDTHHEHLAQKTKKFDKKTGKWSDPKQIENQFESIENESFELDEKYDHVVIRDGKEVELDEHKIGDYIQYKGGKGGRIINKTNTHLIVQPTSELEVPVSIPHSYVVKNYSYVVKNYRESVELDEMAGPAVLSAARAHAATEFAKGRSRADVAHSWKRHPANKAKGNIRFNDDNTVHSVTESTGEANMNLTPVQKRIRMVIESYTSKQNELNKWSVNGLDEWNAKEMLAAAQARLDAKSRKGRYGTEYTGDEDDEGKPKFQKPGTEKVKRGRGRPAGSKSGARTHGDDGGTAGGTGEYHLRIPQKSVYY